MATKTIKNLLVGIGFDVDKESMGEASGSIAIIGKRALAMGGLLAGAFGASAKAASDFADSVDPIAKFAEIMGLLPGEVQAMGNALRSEGGTLEGMMSQLRNIEELRAGLLTGDAGWMEAAGKAGINQDAIIEASDAIEAYMALADQFASMSQDERLNAASALSLDEASIRLLSQGEQYVRDLMNHYENIRPITKEMADNAKKQNDEWLELTQNLGGFYDRVANEITGATSDALESMNDWIDKNRGGIKGFIDSEMNSWKFIGDLLSGGDVGDYSIGGVTFDQMGDYLGSLIPDFGTAQSAPQAQQGNSYRGTVIREVSPVTIKNDVHLDSQVIKRIVNQHNQEQASRAIEDLTSSAD